MPEKLPNKEDSTKVNANDSVLLASFFINQNKVKKEIVVEPIGNIEKPKQGEKKAFIKPKFNWLGEDN